MIDISIIIVSFNTRDLTVECVRSIVRTVKNSIYQIIIVDNNSTDDSVAALRHETRRMKHESRIKIIENRENMGFSKANNIGVEKSRGRYVLFLNSDTVVYERTIDGMIQFMDENIDAGASTCFVRLPNGKLDDAAHRGFPTPWRAFSHFLGLSKTFGGRLFGGYNLRHLSLDRVHEIDALAGAFMLVRREAAEEVGWWDEDFFWYGEDLDFCFRLRERGFKIYFVPEFEILHYKGASGGLKKHSKHISIANGETRKRAHDARFSAMKIFYDKHYRTKYPSLIRSLVVSGIYLKKIIERYRLQL